MKSTEQVLSLNSPAVLKTRPPHRLGGAHRRGAGYLLLCWCNGWIITPCAPVRCGDPAARAWALSSATRSVQRKMMGDDERD